MVLHKYTREDQSKGMRRGEREWREEESKEEEEEDRGQVKATQRTENELYYALCVCRHREGEWEG